MLDLDFKKAYSELRSVEGTKQVNWNYSIAFLHACKGDMRNAIKFYNRAFAQTDANNIDNIDQIVSFIRWTFNKEPKLVQLQYCLGLIFLNGKKDHEEALSSFEDFILCCPESEFIEQRNQAKLYIGELQQESRRDRETA